MFRLLWIMVFAAFLAGCGSATPWGAVYGTVVDERSTAQIAQDRQIKTRIEAAYASDSEVSYFGITPYAFLNEAYIVGEYSSEMERDKALQIARTTEGVYRVHHYLLPKQDSECGFMDRQQMRAELNYELYGTSGVSATNIELSIVQCDVVLVGIVGSQAEIDKAISIVKAIEGVKNVKSFLRTMPRPGTTGSRKS